MDNRNRQKASEVLGSDFSEDQYQEWLSKNQNTIREDMEVQEELDEDYLTDDDDANRFAEE